MKSNIWLIVMICWLVGSCSVGSKPGDVLSAKKMVPILVDIHLAEAIHAQRFSINLNKDSLQEDLYLSICRKHKIDRSTLEKSLLYYGQHTREYLAISKEVLDVLSEMEVNSKKDTARPTPMKHYTLDTTQVKKPQGKPIPNSQIR
ncbi:MAG: DUF4296 domain-containing protein [Marinilabiliales bacterium]|nr:DUF4296 domain-containing protein [Marinilabiliales bacterium]